MDLREGQNITRPPLLEGNKYGYWRVRMKAFLKSQDESVWEAVEQGWTHPVATDEEGKVSLLSKDKWTEVQKKAEAANSKAMNAIFSGIDGKNFKMISTCEIAKRAWDILRTAHEGTTKVKISSMETVTSKFENLRMQEDETIADFNTRVLDISNEAFALGEPMTEETLVRKVLRSDEPYLYDSSSHQIPPIPALYYANSYFLVLFCISGDLEALGGIALKRRHFVPKTSQLKIKGRGAS
ncbi:unnamed protein product [Rhodiola kirilowii]